MDDRPFGRRDFDPDDEVRQAREAMQRTMRRVRRLAPLALGAIVLLWLASGVYIVNPGELGVVRQFGKEIGQTTPGLQYHLPWPIQTADVVNVEEVRRIEIGFRTQQGQAVRVPSESLMLTGDENIVDVQLIVQYRVSNPTNYLFRLRDPEQTLHRATEVAVRSVVGNMDIEYVLTEGRAEVQDLALGYLQTLMDDYQSGLQILNLRLQVVDPPDQVRDAFHEVVRAREDRERLVNEAEAYRADVVPRARGEAEQQIHQAEAYKERRVLEAQGDVARFIAVLQEYHQAPQVTRERLYLETVERVMGNLDKIVIDGGMGQGILPYLPLNELRRTPQTQTPQPGS